MIHGAFAGRSGARRLERNTHGATAIEYAILAGLIGLGLVGSLVTTRGSLAGVYGKAASQVEAGSRVVPASTSPAAATWEARTLMGAPAVATAGSVKQTAYTYSDGRQVIVLRDDSVSPTRITVAQIAPDHRSAQTVVFTETGVQLARIDTTFQDLVTINTTAVTVGASRGEGYVVPNWNARQATDAITHSYWFENNVPRYAYYNNYETPDGSWRFGFGGPGSDLTPTWVGTNAGLAQDWKYFKDISS